MAPGIYHSVVVTGSNDGTKQVSLTAWNAAHVINEDTIYPRPIFADVSDTTKRITTTLSGATTGKTLTLISAHTDNRSITFPDATTTLAGLAVSQTFTTQQTISPTTTVALILTPTSGPTGGASEFIGSLSVPAATVAFATSAQTGDYVTSKINQATLTNPSAGTVPNASSLKIVGAPIAGTNVTITNAYALWVASGATLLAGAFTINNGGTLNLFNPAGTFKYVITAAALTGADRILNLPLITGTDTLAALGLAQTWTKPQTLFGVIDTLAALTSSANITIDFDTEETMTLTLAHNTTFATSNKGAGKRKTIFITCDGTTRTMAFPAWKPQGAALPASILANKTATLTLECESTTDASIRAAYAAEP